LSAEENDDGAHDAEDVEGRPATGDELEVLQPDGKVLKFTAEKIFDAEGNEIESTAHSMMAFSIPCPFEVAPMSIIRKLAK
jgi:hypothetical protein